MLNELKRLYNYNPTDGLFTRKISNNTRYPVGQIAGTKNHHSGYVYIKINGKRYSAHRLAWLYVHGEFPNGEIDHKDRDKSNNRILNLRDFTRSENMLNTGLQSNNKTGIKGVSMRSNGKFVARVGLNNKRIQLGTFATKEEAGEAVELHIKTRR